MPVLDIVRLGHPALRTPAAEVARSELGGPTLDRLIEDLIETMYAASGVGLAAPQVGVGLQLFVWDGSAGEAGEGAAGVVVNPMVEPEPGDLVYDWEGCLSIPDLRGLVPRHPGVRLHGLGRRGEPLDLRAEGLEARVIQHEFDHLNGVVFLDRMRDLRSLAYEEEMGRYLAADAVPEEDPPAG